MVRFSNLEMRDGKLVETEIREIDQSTIAKCPHVIFVPEHYRSNGTCKCDDPNETVMKTWGYRWDEKLKLWR